MKQSTSRAYLNFPSCTWNKFFSLAICSKCLNITSSVKKTCNDSGCYELSLPGGPSLFGFGGQINSSITQVSTNLDDIEASVVRFSSLISKRMNDSDDVLAVRHISKLLFPNPCCFLSCKTCLKSEMFFSASGYPLNVLATPFCALLRKY